ncbi:hypothetical protein DF133_29795 [Burkholderia cenocepacia]|nr:hypothetical protein DF133_29795 [Burkholderia cenocepacia]
MIDYGIFYRRSIDVARIPSELPDFDIFVSAYNSSDRVGIVFNDVRAQRKFWLLHPEYQFSVLEEPNSGIKIKPAELGEVHQVEVLLGEIGDVSGKSICLDITGFMRHVLAFLVAKLAHLGVREFTALYSEPVAYTDQENTVFSTQTSGKVAPVRGMAGSNHSAGVDHLILGVGFDHKMMGQVLNHKDNMTVYPVFAFPSLSPDMYQQSAIRSSDSGDAAIENAWIVNRKFAPANDPFSTAAVLSSVVKEIDRIGGGANIYLTPLSTKVQTLGFALYWQLEGRLRQAVSVLLPECVTYSRETSRGLKRLWAYTVELS